MAWIKPPGQKGGDEETMATFASGSHDQSVMLYSWHAGRNAVEAVNSLRGHERSVDCLAASPGLDGGPPLLASGSFDTTLKIWGTKVVVPQGGEAVDGDEEKDGTGKDTKKLVLHLDANVVSFSSGEKQKKRSKSEKKTPTRTPLMTLGGHKEGVSGVAWLGSDSELATCSWDHTVKLWDCGEMRGMKSELVGDRSFFGMSYSPLNRTIVTCSADSAIR